MNAYSSQAHGSVDQQSNDLLRLSKGRIFEDTLPLLEAPASPSEIRRPRAS